MYDLIRLLRIHQWYKNLLVFTALVFSLSMFKVELFMLTVLGFLSLSLMSSTNYIINDILDIKSDRKHPEKRKRPIASGSIKIWQGLVIAILLAIFSIMIAYHLSKLFMFMVLILFVLTQMYSIYLKNEPFADVLTIAGNFVIRALSGVFIINVKSSVWLILCPFFLALFLAIGKREADIIFLGKDAASFKKVLKYYTKSTTQTLMGVATTLLIISYSLYSVSINTKLLITLPFALYVIMRYFYLVRSGSKVGRKPHFALLDSRIMIGVSLWLLSVFLALYGNFI